MSSDIVLFNSRQKITSVEEVDDTNFCSAFEGHFTQIAKDDNHREIKGKRFSIDYLVDEDKVSNKMLSLFGENGLFELLELAKKYKWQIFDPGAGQMIDLENRANNGMKIFEANFVTC